MTNEIKKPEPKTTYHLHHEKCVNGTWHPAGVEVALTESEAIAAGLIQPLASVESPTESAAKSAKKSSALAPDVNTNPDLSKE